MTLHKLKTTFGTAAIQASYGIEDPEFAITQLAQTTMRSEIGKISLDMLFKVKREAKWSIDISKVQNI